MEVVRVQASPDSASDLCDPRMGSRTKAAAVVAKCSSPARASKNEGPLMATSHNDLSPPDTPVAAPGPGSAALAAERLQRAHAPHASTGNLYDVPALQQDVSRCSTSSCDVPPAQRRRRVRSETAKLPTPPPSPFEQWSAIPFTKPLPPAKDVQNAPAQQQQLDQHPRLKQRATAGSLTPTSTAAAPAPLLTRASRSGPGSTHDALALAMPEPDMTAAMAKGSKAAAQQQQQQQASYLGSFFAKCMFCAPRMSPC